MMLRWLIPTYRAHPLGFKCTLCVCGYDLRGSLSHIRCPECGRGVQALLPHLDLLAATGRVRADLVRASLLFVSAIVLWLLAVIPRALQGRDELAMAIIGPRAWVYLLFVSTSPAPSSVPAYWVPALEGMLAIVAINVGAFFLTRLPREIEPGGMLVVSACVVRAIAILQVLIVTLEFFCSRETMQNLINYWTFYAFSRITSHVVERSGVALLGLSDGLWLASVGIYLFVLIGRTSRRHHARLVLGLFLIGALLAIAMPMALEMPGVGPSRPYVFIGLVGVVSSMLCWVALLRISYNPIVKRENWWIWTGHQTDPDLWGSEVVNGRTI